jgi:hypothetical protein
LKNLVIGYLRALEVPKKILSNLLPFLREILTKKARSSCVRIAALL